MSKLVKRYVLVDADVHERMGAVAQTKRTVSSLPNPFQNPDVEEAKRLRRDMHEVAGDPTLDVEAANAELRSLMNKYLNRYGNVRGKKARIPVSSPEDDGWNGVRGSARNRKAVQTPRRATSSNSRTLFPRSPKREIPHPTDEDWTDSSEPLVKVKGDREEEERDNDNTSITPFVTRVGAIRALDRSMVPQVFEQKMTAGQVDSAYPLLNEMYKLGMLNEDGMFQEIRGEAYKMSDPEIRKAIKDLVLSSPTRRTTNPTRANWLVNHLRNRGVVETEIRSPRQRKSSRNRKSKY